MEVVTQKEVEVKEDVEITKWKALALEQLAKAILFNQLLENQGDELYVVLIEAWLLMVQLYYKKEQDMVMQLNVTHVSLSEWEKSEGTKSKEKEEDQDVVCKITITEFVEHIGKKE